MLTELYGKAKATISEHISNVFEEGELEQDSVVRLFRTTAADGKTYQVQHYSLPFYLRVKGIFTMAADYEPRNKEPYYV